MMVSIISIFELRLTCLSANGKNRLGAQETEDTEGGWSPSTQTVLGGWGKIRLFPMRSSGSGRNRAKTPSKNFCGGYFEKRISERIFARLRTQSVLVGLLAFKPSETRKAESNY